MTGLVGPREARGWGHAMGYAVTPLRLETHREALARLWAENMSDPRIAAAIPTRLRWLYEECPDGRPTTMLCVEGGSAEIVGCGSFFPRPTWAGGRRLRAAVLCDFAVTRAHRVLGAALAIQRGLVEAALASGIELLYGYPNQRSVGVFKRVGYQVVGETATWVKPLRSAYKLRSLLRSRWAAAAAAPAVDAGLAALDLLRGLRIPTAARGELHPGPVADLTSLAERARTARGVVGDKSAPYLDWRYGRFPTLQHGFFGLAARQGAPSDGAAVFTVEDGKASLRDLTIAPGPGAEAALLMGLATHLRAQGVDSLSLSYVGGPAFGERLRRLGFLRRPGGRSLVVHAEALAAPLRALVCNPGSWLMLDGELDI